MGGSLGSFLSILTFIWCCDNLTNAKQFKDFSFAELTTLGQELEGPFASVQTAEKLWGHEDLVMPLRVFLH